MDEVVRGVGPVPEVPTPFVGRDGDVVRLAEELWSADGPRTLVLHGPAGVGKSALAAALARRVPVYWVAFTGEETEEQVLLRLLALREAPRRAVVEAYTSGPEVYGPELRRQCEEYIGQSWVVLDDVPVPLGLRLLPQLVACRMRVIVTSRKRAVWRDTGARLHAVRPLGTRKAAALAERCAEAQDSPPGGFRDDLGLLALLRAARGRPALVRVAGAVAGRTRGARFEDVTDPRRLVDLALECLTEPQLELLRRLALTRRGTTFARYAPGILIQGADPLDSLRALQKLDLVTRVRDDRYTVPEPVAELVGSHLTPGRRLRLARSTQRALWQDAQADLRELARLLDGRELQDPYVRQHQVSPSPERTRRVDELMALIPEPGLLRAEDAEFIGALAELAAVRGDAHRLVALHSAFPGPTRGALSATARHLGLPRRSWQVLEDEGDSAALAHGNADTAYGAGLLTSCLEALTVTSPHHEADAGWYRVVRGAALCDQGRVAQAEAELLRAAETHRATGCARGRGWALLHHARVCLLTAQVNRAQHALDQSATLLRTAGDIRGQNWAATERIRLHLLFRKPDKALEAAQRALTAHEAAEDLRGMGWTCQYLGIVHARAGRTADAIVALQAATRHFERCEDSLGAAWARHRLAVLSPGPEQSDELTAAKEMFTSLGCPHGQAWSLLELTLRRPADADLQVFGALAQRLFGELDDVAGTLWSAIVLGLRSEVGLGRSMFPTDLSPDIVGRDQVLQDLQSFQEALTQTPGPVSPTTRAWRGPAIPLRARDLLALSTKGTRHATPRCRVRLTLLDDSPTSTSTARLLLRVVPEGAHPWTARDGDPPWLTAVALPLTPVSVEPPVCHLRPSELPAHGAEFDVTAHRPGIHVIRFTIALERTGTVLQQVETELEILDTDRPGRHAAPQTAARRGW
ncbi:NB-ARC domain-containing protein [Streptomyces sp. TUS-ST3]|uniref:NB-ARC domain-containing protein n=1 Tax=Streptomyces sp. TUS-ST3 TaxID=3025591 RepID=UPI0024E104D3|nr:NB-ARC domain-containing protein [Streptomyces sp. TUS-ST3]